MEQGITYTATASVLDKLSELQQAVHVGKNQFNSFGKYKYRKCEDILIEIKPILKELGCTVVLTDVIREVAGVIFVDASATLHYKGDSITVNAQAGIDVNKKGMDVAQTFGSSSSYARKNALAALLLLDDGQDPDTLDNTGKKVKHQQNTSWKNAGSNEYQQLVSDLDLIIKSARYKELPAAYRNRADAIYKGALSSDMQPELEVLQKCVEHLKTELNK